MLKLKSAEKHFGRRAPYISAALAETLGQASRAGISKNELQPKLLVSPLIGLMILPYIIPYITALKKFRLWLKWGGLLDPGACCWGLQCLGFCRAF